MNFGKEYIIQAISCASNNLRLSTEKIEIVTQIKKYFEAEEDTALIIYLMKQKTEFSKFALRLDKVLKFILSTRPDFIKISDTFKEHSHFITHEFGALLDILSSVSIKKLLGEITESKLNFQKAHPGVTGDSVNKVNGKNPEGEILKEEEEPKKEEFSFEDFEKKILRPIKAFDAFLSKLPTLNYTEKEINEVADLVKLNADLASNVGFDIIGEMHYTLFKSLKLIHEKKISATKDTIESMRACLIVIVAVVRRKEVDISKYLKKAESFGRTLVKTKGN